MITAVRSHGYPLRNRVTTESDDRQIPNVHADLLAALDERGLVRVGQPVAPGSLLIGRVTPSAHSTSSPEEKLLRAIFGEVASDVDDSSLRCPPGCFGTVVAADLLEPGKHERARARVTIRGDHRLARSSLAVSC